MGFLVRFLRIRFGSDCGRWSTGSPVEKLVEVYWNVCDYCCIAVCRARGHSLGGLYALWYGANYPEVVDGLVLAAPSVENKPIMSSEEQAKFSLAARSAPETMLKTRKNSLLNVSKELDEYLPVTRSFSVRYLMGIGSFLMRDRMFVNASNDRKPTLILQGDADEYTLPIGAKRLFESIAAEDKRLELVPGANHTLYGAILSFASAENNLKEQEFVLSLIGDWIGSH